MEFLSKKVSQKSETIRNYFYILHHHVLLLHQCLQQTSPCVLISLLSTANINMCSYFITLKSKYLHDHQIYIHKIDGGFVKLKVHNVKTANVVHVCQSINAYCRHGVKNSKQKVCLQTCLKKNHRSVKQIL